MIIFNQLENQLLIADFGYDFFGTKLVPEDLFMILEHKNLIILNHDSPLVIIIGNHLLWHLQ